ncbi:MAG: arsenic resistance protein [Desulfovibrio sp.]|uniref:arsenic resistance protein n=1 Tax=Desulfovibrio sp. 7SRBS1 TaxID=3378064 RepID=UPI003B409BF2
MWHVLRKITKNLTLAIPTMMVLGFVFGIFTNAGWLRNLIIPFTFLMVYPMMVTLKIRQVFQGGDGKAQLITQFVNFAVIPFLAWGIGRMFFADKPFMALGLLLAGLLPTSGMTISWTGFAKGNMAAAVKMTVVGLIGGSLLTPLYVQVLMGESIAVDVGLVFKQIFFIVFLPMVLGYATQRWLVRKNGQEHFQKFIGPRFPPLSTIGVLGIVFVALALKARTIAHSPSLLLVILVPLVILYAVNFTLSTLVGRWLLPRNDAIAMVYGSVMRNLSIALAIAMNAFGEQGADAALVVAAAYIIQVQSAAWYVKLTPNLFGRQSTEQQTA